MAEYYNYKEIEKKWRMFWEKEKIYQFNPIKNKKIYSVDTPPPYSSGKMHIGHAFSYSQQDFVIRYHRMIGDAVYYPFGTDDNGLPTERLVEKLKNVKSTKMSRHEFVQLCEKTIKEKKPDFVEDWKIIGMSCDFSASYSTIDKHCIKTSQKSFIDLFKKDLVYQNTAPTMWCVQCQTAIAQADLEDKEFDSSFNDIQFELENGKKIVVSTTRPELLAACVMVYVNPDDKKNKELIGKDIKVPIFNQKVKIYADESADPNKGSGILMVCSYGDKYDVEALNKRKEKLRIIFTKEGKLNSLAGKYEGLSIIEARKEILKNLEEQSLLINKKLIKHHVNVHERCGTEIEFLTTKQWFVKILENKQKFIEVGKKINWYPEFMRVRYEHWIEGLQWDWCISRQRHFGVPFPVWYCVNCNNVSVADEKDLPVYPFDSKPKKKCKCGSSKFEGEQDVMDTWATSSVTPQIILNWVKDKEYNTNIKMYPCSLRPQAHDIIRTWAFYTIVKGIYHNNKHPWKDIVISGHVLDPNGQSMHKSKGNVIEPSKVLEKYSADALRFWAASSKLGDDLRYLEKELETGQKTLTKLWNSFKFVKLSLENYKHKKLKKLEPIDELFLLELNSIVKEYRKNFEIYEYSKSKYAIDNFFWHSFCDYYLEFVKKRIYNNTNGKESAQYTLYTSLFSIIKMFAPIMPFVTEEIYQDFFRKHEKEKSIHLILIQRYNPKMKDTKELWQLLIGTISKIRQEKARLNKSLKEEVKTITCDLKLKDFENDIKGVMNVKEIKYGKEFSIHV